MENAGRYDDDGETCDDLRFFLRHVGRGGLLHRVEEDLVVYTLSEGLSSMTHRKALVKCAGGGLSTQILDGPWKGRKIHVWGAGRDGRCFLNELASLGRASAVEALYDVDDAKIGKYHNGATGLSMPVLHVDRIQMPFVVCVSMRNPELVSFVRAALPDRRDPKEDWILTVVTHAISGGHVQLVSPGEIVYGIRRMVASHHVAAMAWRPRLARLDLAARLLDGEEGRPRRELLISTQSPRESSRSAPSPGPRSAPSRHATDPQTVLTTTEL